MADRSNMEAWAQKAFKLAAQKGAGEARASVSRSRFISVVMRDGRLEKASSSIKQGLSLSLFINGRYGVHSTSDFATLESFVDKACRFTQKLTPDKWRALPARELMATGGSADLGNYDKDLAALPLDFWLDLARQIDGATANAGAKLEFVSSQGGAYLNVDERFLADSRGFSGYESATSGFALSSLTIMDAGNKRRQGYWYSGGCQAGQLTKTGLALDLAERARTRAVAQLGAKVGPSGSFPVLVENSAAGNLTGYLLGAMNGASLHHKTSYLQDKLHSAIAAACLTIVDRPLMQGGLGSRWFDGEGMAARDLTLLDKGVLQNYLLDTYYAKALGLEPTTGSTSNLTLAPSVAMNGAQLLSQVPRGLLLTNFLGGNFNSTTGDFSLGLSGQWVENGKIAYAVEGMNMSGNFAALWNSLSAVGNDAFMYDSNMTPSLMFSTVRLSGA